MSEDAVFAHAATAAPHTLAAEAGRDILLQGGNAIEAMVAMAASIAVVYPHMNGIGGDGFWVDPRAERQNPGDRGLRLRRREGDDLGLRSDRRYADPRPDGRAHRPRRDRRLENRA